ncbi:MAG: FHA domain-containing protein [Archangium sp.]
MISLLVPVDGAPTTKVPLDYLETHTIGRTVENDIVLEHPGVSRRHLHLIRDGFTVFVEDLGSANGTYVNGELQPRRARFEPGDRLRVGGYPHELTLEERLLTPDELGTYAALALSGEEQRLVHADALEMEGQLDVANWLRLEVELRRHERGTPAFLHAQHELAEAAKKVLPRWRALLARTPIERCSRGFCPREWSKLLLTPRPHKRSCSVCKAEVTFCDTLNEARARHPALLVIDPARVRRPYDVAPPPMPVG